MFCSFISMKIFLSAFIVCYIFFSCKQNESIVNPITDNTEQTSPTNASVEEVAVTGTEGGYTFNVTLNSPDEGCNQYADWWEVISTDGETLLHRRVLLHSHVNEQPFTRSGGPITISKDETVIIRGHMNNSGYFTNALIGNVNTGFSPATLESDFATGLDSIEPLPEGCAF